MDGSVSALTHGLTHRLRPWCGLGGGGVGRLLLSSIQTMAINMQPPPKAPPPITCGGWGWGGSLSKRPEMLLARHVEITITGGPARVDIIYFVVPPIVTNPPCRLDVCSQIICSTSTLQKCRKTDRFTGSTGFFSFFFYSIDQSINWQHSGRKCCNQVYCVSSRF